MSDQDAPHGWNPATKTCTCGVLCCPKLRTDMHRRAESINRRAAALSNGRDDPPRLAIPRPR